MKSQPANDEPVVDPRHRDQVAALAYRLYLDNGARSGREMEDWLQAERLVAASHKVAEGNGSGHANKTTPHPPRTINQPDAPNARDERGSPSREELRQQATPSRSAPRQSQRPRERSSQPRSHTR